MLVPIWGGGTETGSQLLSELSSRTHQWHSDREDITGVLISPSSPQPSGKSVFRAPETMVTVCILTTPCWKSYCTILFYVQLTIHKHVHKHINCMLGVGGFNGWHNFHKNVMLQTHSHLFSCWWHWLVVEIPSSTSPTNMLCIFRVHLSMKKFVLFALLKMFKIVNESLNYDIVSEFGWKNLRCWSIRYWYLQVSTDTESCSDISVKLISCEGKTL